MVLSLLLKMVSVPRPLLVLRSSGGAGGHRRHTTYRDSRTSPLHLIRSRAILLLVIVLLVTPGTTMSSSMSNSTPPQRVTKATNARASLPSAPPPPTTSTTIPAEIANNNNQGLNILLFPLSQCRQSHLYNMEKLAKILLDGGHNVTMLVSDQYSVMSSAVQLHGVHTMQYTAPKDDPGVCSYRSLDAHLTMPITEMAARFFESTYNHCDSLLNDPRILATIKEQNFDIAIFESVDQCSKIIVDELDDMPSIFFFTGGLDTLTSRNPAYLPTILTPFDAVMSLPERVLNTLAFGLQFVGARSLYSRFHELKVKHHLNTDKHLSATYNRVSVKFVLADLALDYCGPIYPSIVLLGGFIHASGPSEHSQVEDILESAENGVVLFSLGSFIHAESSHWVKVFAEGLGKLPYTVLWKLDGKNRNLKLSNNTHVFPWLPQTKILAHPKTVAFITHGGLNSVHETAYYGVPALVLPFTMEQQYQTNKLVNRAKMAIQQDIRTLTPDDIYVSVIQLVENPSYGENAKRVSSIMNANKRNQTQDILDWVQYTVATNGARHLHSEGEENLAIYEVLLLDVLGVIAAIFIIFALMLHALFKALWRAVKKYVNYLQIPTRARKCMWEIFIIDNYDNKTE